jgi:hypothetical protein
LGDVFESKYQDVLVKFHLRGEGDFSESEKAALYSSMAIERILLIKSQFLELQFEKTKFHYSIATIAVSETNSATPLLC